MINHLLWGRWFQLMFIIMIISIIAAFFFTIIMMLYFGVIRLLDNKKKEFLQFLVLYIFALFCMIWLGHFISREENWPIFLTPIAMACYIPPTFMISYILYPFKIIKRNRILIWVLLGYTILIMGGGAVLSILIANSNM